MNVLEDEKMRELGFTDRIEGSWYLCKQVAYMTTLNICIEKGGSDWSENVLDEFFLQPCFYMDAKEEFKNEVISNIDGVISTLRRAGLDVSVDHKSYTMG